MTCLTSEDPEIQELASEIAEVAQVRYDPRQEPRLREAMANGMPLPEAWTRRHGLGSRSSGRNSGGSGRGSGGKRSKGKGGAAGGGNAGRGG